MDNKFKKHNELISILKKYKKNKKKIVLCHGVFDVLHSGHIMHFREAKAHGDILIVSITDDKFINKGPNRPFYNLDQRMKMVSSLSIVDLVIPSLEVTAISNLSLIKPDLYCKGLDYKNEKDDLTNNIIREKNILKKNKGKIIYTKSPKHSSSNILKSEFNFINNEQKAYLKKFKNDSSLKLRDYFKKIENLRVLVIGEIIIDSYIFGEAVGKSSKDPIIVLNENQTENYLGGAGSIAKNMSSFSKNVTLLTLNKKNCPKNTFIKNEINNSFKVKYFNKNNFKTITKKRFVESINNRKLLGLYDLNDDLIDPMNENKIINFLKANKSRYDVVVIADYGHGFISDKIASCISMYYKKSFLNSQINSFNVRSQNINKYKKSFCIIINESELRLDLRDSNNDINHLSNIFFSKYKIKVLVITSGSKGATIFFSNTQLKSIHCPAFGSEILDKTGSGDSLLTLFSLCQTSGMRDELSILIGSLAAAESLKHIANSNLINKNNIIKSVENLLA
ncbi:PfkB family carbohydrate kinase [bacterium]|nr:PfkB family carbohydrate kinase [bacterium]